VDAECGTEVKVRERQSPHPLHKTKSAAPAKGKL
jgi:hypothetical protein